MQRGIKRIIFASGSGVTRAPMAEMILKQEIEERGIKDPPEVLSRGTIVSFPEPVNQKAEAVMVSNGLKCTGYTSKELTGSDVIEGTLVFTVSEKERQRILREIEPCNEDNTFVVTDFVGEELPVMDPIGGTLATYGLCFEALCGTLKKLMEKLFD